MDINEIFESIKKNRKVIFDLKTLDFGCFVLIGTIQGKETNFENNVGYSAVSARCVAVAIFTLSPDRVIVQLQSMPSAL